MGGVEVYSTPFVFLTDTFTGKFYDFSIWFEFIHFATMSMFFDAFVLSPEDAAMLNHIWARTYGARNSFTEWQITMGLNRTLYLGRRATIRDKFPC